MSAKETSEMISRIDPNGVYDLTQAAKVIGAARSTLQFYIGKKLILPAKIGKSYRFTGKKLLDFLNGALL